MPTTTNVHTEKVFEDELCAIVARASPQQLNMKACNVA